MIPCPPRQDNPRSHRQKFFSQNKHDRQLSCSYAIMQTEMRKAVYPMKMERLIGILSILLQRERVTAPELAEQFEVSRRTIQRDIESLCRAGIPISTAQGAGGGISIMEGYRVDRTVLTAPEMQAILAGLRSLDSVSGTRRYAQLMEKLSAGTAPSSSTAPSALPTSPPRGSRSAPWSPSTWCFTGPPGMYGVGAGCVRISACSN